MSQPLVVIPTYNESLNIEGILQAVRAALPKAAILVVDDSSPDGTADIVKGREDFNRSVFLLSRTKKEGLGRAYMAGFSWAVDHNYGPICSMDADFSHNPADLPKLIKVTKTSNAIAIGSRYIPGGKILGWRWYRHVLSRGANLTARTLLGLKIKDVTAGFKSYPAEFLRKLPERHVYAPGYAFQVEMLVLANDRGYTLTELPIIFHDRTAGSSKVSRSELVSSAQSLLRMAWHRPAIRQFRRFVIVGAINFAVDLGLTALFIKVFGWNELIAGLAGTTLALLQSYFLNRHWTFREHKGNFWHQLAGFLAVNGSGAGINFVFYGLLIRWGHLPFGWAKLGATAGSFLWNFFGTKHLVFKKKNA